MGEIKEIFGNLLIKRPEKYLIFIHIKFTNVWKKSALSSFTKSKCKFIRKTI